MSKIATVVLYILSHFPSGLNIEKLFMLMFFAQSDVLTIFQKTLFRDNFKLIGHCIAPSLLYDALINQEDTQVYKSLLSSIKIKNNKNGDKIILPLQKPNLKLLTKDEINILYHTVKKYNYASIEELYNFISANAAIISVKGRIKDDPQRNIITFIDMARANNASKNIIDNIRISLECEILHNKEFM